MRTNRRVYKKMSRIVSHSMSVGGVILLLFLMVIFNLMGTSQCSQLMKSINDKERQLVMCKAELDRSVSQWESAKASGNLERSLLKRGMAMNYPNPRQIIRMDGKGKPLPGQTSVALLQRRANAFKTARYDAPVRSASSRRTIR